MDTETITIPLGEYNKLKQDQAILSALEAGGVAGWEWYSASLYTYLPEGFKYAE